MSFSWRHFVRSQLQPARFAASTLAGRHFNKATLLRVMAEPGKAWFLVRLNWGTLGRLVDYYVKNCRVSRNRRQPSLPNGESQVWEKKSGVGELADPQFPGRSAVSGSCIRKGSAAPWEHDSQAATAVPSCCWTLNFLQWGRSPQCLPEGTQDGSLRVVLSDLLFNGVRKPFQNYED